MELLKIFQKMRLIGVAKPGHGILHAEIFIKEGVPPYLLVTKEGG